MNPDSRIYSTFLSTFRSLYGQTPDVVFQAPGRVNCIGDHTDYQGGWSLPIAITLATTVGLSWRTDGLIQLGSALDTMPRWQGPLDKLQEAGRQADHDAPLQGLFGFAAAAVDLLAIDRGFDLWVSSTLPAGSGLSSSAALALALLSCLAHPSPMDPKRLVQLAQTVENRYLGVHTGILDQTAIVFAKAGQAVLIDAGKHLATPIPFDFSSRGYRFWIIDTKTPCTLAASAYDIRVQEAKDASMSLGLDLLCQASPKDFERISDSRLRRRARHIISENLRVQSTVECAKNGDWAGGADRLSESHRSLRDDYEVSTPTLDKVVSVVVDLRKTLSWGNAGARLTGAGFGGSVVALLPQDATAKLQEALTEAFPEELTRPVATAIDGAAEGLRQLG